MKNIGIWLPIEVIQDETLTHTEKFLLMDIMTLDKLDKGCIASNSYFSELLKMTRNNISRSLHSLEEKGHIKIETKEGSRNHKRVIKMILKGYQNDTKGLSKREQTKETIPMTKTITIVEYLNKKASKSYKSTTPKTKQLISARLSEGFTVQDFENVIDLKVSEWQDDEKMKKFLRPETLFGTKFESYLQEGKNQEPDWSICGTG